MDSAGEQRVNCCVPFCRRTIGAGRLASGDDEWICGMHWALAPKRMRRAYHRARRRGRRYGKGCKGTYRLWRRLKRAIMERAAGI